MRCTGFLVSLLPFVFWATTSRSDVGFSEAAGFKKQSITVSLKGSGPGLSLRFTLDGSEPTLTTGEAYAGSLALSNTAVVRAALFSSRERVSPVFTHTFLFLDRIVHQTNAPLGYPTGSTVWNGYPAEYGMSAAIVDSSVYRPRITNAMQSLPSLCLAVGPEALFGATNGIYLHSQERGLTWERPCAAEWFQPDGILGFAVDCGLRIQGNSNRIPEKTPKRSFRLFFREKYGPARLRYPVFSDSKVEAFNTLVLRAEFNNSWTHWNPVAQVRGQRIRDAWLKDSQRATGSLAGHSRFVHLYLNGLYWGIYDVTERPDATFAAANLGDKRGDYDVLNEGQVKDGDAAGYAELMNASHLEQPAEYQKLQRMLDVPGYIDYLLVNYYAGNHDWGENKNWYAIGRRGEFRHFRYLCWDGEFILQDLTDNVVGGGAQPFRLLAELRNNPDFMTAMADRIHQHFFGEGVLTPGPATDRWLARAHELDPAIIAESARWGGYRRDPPYNRDQDWIGEQQRLLTNWFPQRTEIVVQQLRSAGLYPSFDPPAITSLITNSELAVTLGGATNGVIYFTTNGSDPRLAISNRPDPKARVYTNSALLYPPLILKARVQQGERWSALVEKHY